MDILQAFDQYLNDAIAAIDAAASTEDLEQVRIEFLGQKKGKAKDLQKLIGKASKEEKPVVGKRFNEVRTQVQEKLADRGYQQGQPLP